METTELERNAAALQVAIASLKELCGDDEDLLRDTIEGETDLDGFAAHCVDQILSDEAFSEAIDNMIDDLRARQKRFENRKDRIRTLLAMTLDAAGAKKVQLPQATISMSQRQPSLVITDEAEIPAEWWKRGDPKLDKRGLAAFLKANSTNKVSGATLDNGAVTLTIRSK
jgi:Arc/MetJ-type ribon-helix-helix transcriptional regulator